MIAKVNLIRNAILVLLILVLLVLSMAMISSKGTIQTSYAAAEPAYCTKIGGIWDGVSTCTFSGQYTLTSGYLTVTNGTTLILTAQTNLPPGALVAPGVLTIDNAPSCGRAINNETGLINDGTIKVGYRGEIINDGYIVNDGTIVTENSTSGLPGKIIDNCEIDLMTDHSNLTNAGYLAIDNSACNSVGVNQLYGTSANSGVIKIANSYDCPTPKGAVATGYPVDGMYASDFTNAGAINIMNSAGFGLVLAQSTFGNSGTITINNTGYYCPSSCLDYETPNDGSAGIFADGIVNTGKIVVENSGIYHTGVGMVTGGHISNYGSITINNSQGADGIYSASLVANFPSGTIDIKDSNNSVGIDSLGGISNSGDINIQTSGAPLSSVGINAEPFIDNSGTITINGNGYAGIQGAGPISINEYSVGVIINNSGTITIAGSEYYGIYQALVLNSGKITVENSPYSGIVCPNTGQGINNTGILIIRNSGERGGILAPSINDTGTITIANYGNVSNIGIYNEGTITVAASGTIKVENAGNDTTGIFNAGPGILHAEGKISTFGSITIANQASTNNTGIYNYGIINVNKSGIINIDNSGNSVGIFNNKTLINDVGGTINLICTGSIVNESGSTFTQDGTVNHESCNPTTFVSTTLTSVSTAATTAATSATLVQTPVTSSTATPTSLSTSSVTSNSLTSGHSTNVISSQSLGKTRSTNTVSATSAVSSSNIVEYATIAVAVLVVGAAGIYFTKKRTP